MNRPFHRALFWAAASLVLVALVDSVGARGGGFRGGGGVGGGRGFSRGGPAAGGSFGQQRPVAGFDRGAYNARGPAADGNFGMQRPDLGGQEERQERREARREERREDWQDYADDQDEDYDHAYYGGYDGTYYDAAGAAWAGPSYWTLPCTPITMLLGGTVYYICGSDWYVRAYSDGEVVYVMVPPPARE